MMLMMSSDAFWVARMEVTKILSLFVYAGI